MGYFILNERITTLQLAVFFIIFGVLIFITLSTSNDEEFEENKNTSVVVYMIGSIMCFISIVGLSTVIVMNRFLYDIPAVILVFYTTMIGVPVYLIGSFLYASANENAQDHFWTYSFS